MRRKGRDNGDVPDAGTDEAAGNKKNVPRKRKKEESEIQKCFFKKIRLAAVYDELYHMVFSIPNGARLAQSRNATTGVVFSAAANRMVADGMMPGVPDVFISIPYLDFMTGKWVHGTYLEFKATLGSQSPEQKEFQRRARELSYGYEIVRTAELGETIVGRIVAAFRGEMKLTLVDLEKVKLVTE